MDQAHEWTDEKIEELTERIHETYEQAKSEMEKKLADWPEEFQRQLKEIDLAVESGEMTRRQRNRAVMRLQTHEKWLGAMVDDLSEQTTVAAERAAAIVNDSLPGICAESMNFATFQVEQQASANTMWTLVDEDTVRLLVEGDRDLLPSVEVGHGSAKKWSARHFQSAVTQGILQGESIPDISARLMEAVGMSESASVRAARTACTGAENAGRTHSFQRANAMGIGVLSEWRATLDMRTRQSHRALNGERVKPGEKFSNGCIEPGDPSGPAEEVWNCRCTLVPYVKGTDYGKNDGRWFEDKTIGGMSYDDWVAGKDLREKTTPRVRADEHPPAQPVREKSILDLIDPTRDSGVQPIHVKPDAKRVTSDDYFKSTVGTFRPSKPPDRPPDHVSGSGSKYWYEDSGLYRSSDHWGTDVASCSWYLEGADEMRGYLSDDVSGFVRGYGTAETTSHGLVFSEQTGFVRFEELHAKEDVIGGVSSDSFYGALRTGHADADAVARAARDVENVVKINDSITGYAAREGLEIESYVNAKGNEMVRVRLANGTTLTSPRTDAGKRQMLNLGKQTIKGDAGPVLEKMGESRVEVLEAMCRNGMLNEKVAKTVEDELRRRGLWRG